jgi:cytidine deaminase
VGSALATDKGNVYRGVCIDTACSMGFCAEHAAIAALVTAGENKILSIVAVDWDGTIISPCGRCREFIYQVDGSKGQTRVILQNRVVKLMDLLPESSHVDSSPKIANT